MKSSYINFFVIFLSFFVSNINAESKNFNDNWLFKISKDNSAVISTYNDSKWERVTLPHDWSVSMCFTQNNAGGATAFLPGGYGTYRKHFKMPLSYKDNKLTFIEFDGIYNNSRIWINGKQVYEHPYGYSPFSINISKYLNYGDNDNVIAVTVDRRAYLDCRWYPGSGIYRNVSLYNKDKINIPINGVYVTTELNDKGSAKLNILTKVNNRYLKNTTATLISQIKDFNGKVIKTVKSNITLSPNENKEFFQSIIIENPHLWDIDSPYLYKVFSSLSFKPKDIVDSCSTRFGIRTIKYDSNKGFFLNGRSLKFKGVCLHHDGGLVGAAVPRDVWIRRLKLLKAAGCNAIRTSHNPASSEFLDLCDEMGFLVQAEFFDEYFNPKDKRKNYNQQETDSVTKGYSSVFKKWCDKDIETIMLRDRNRPCIVMWSIGNEIEWTFPEYGVCTGYWDKDRPKGVDYYFSEPPYSQEKIKELFYQKHKNDLGEMALHLSKVVKSFDKIRPVTANLVMPSVSSFTDYGKALDIMGYSYRAAVYDYCHKLYPDKMIFGSENWVQYHEWEAVEKRDFVAGVFLWTGISYMGESKRWPVRGSGSGMIDFAGFPNPSYYMIKSVWSKAPIIKLYTQKLADSPYMWNADKNELVEKVPGWWKKQEWAWQKVNSYWDYNEKDETVVEAYGNSPIAELFLNGMSLGKKRLKDFEDKIIKWKVPFESGTLLVKGYNDDGKEITSSKIITPSIADKIVLEVDKNTLRKGNFGSVSHIVAHIVDKNGNPIENNEFKISFDVKGTAARIFGVDNGAIDNVQKYQSNVITTNGGKALMIIGQKDIKGSIYVTASCNNLQSNIIKIDVR